jgi:hypothetical protein
MAAAGPVAGTKVVSPDTPQLDLRASCRSPEPSNLVAQGAVPRHRRPMIDVKDVRY